LKLYRITYEKEPSYSQKVNDFIKFLKQINDLEILNVIKEINK
jgi:hypothetical protein